MSRTKSIVVVDLILLIASRIFAHSSVSYVRRLVSGPAGGRFAERDRFAMNPVSQPPQVA